MKIKHAKRTLISSIIAIFVCFTMLIGGVGTLISSLASLITFREYTSHVKGQTLKYVGLFSALNFGFLIILTAVMLIVM